MCCYSFFIYPAGWIMVCKIIRIFNGCESLIENSVTRVTIRHHEACRVMPNSYPNDGIINLHRRTIMDFIFLHTLPSTIAFRLEYVLFYQFYAKISTFFDQEQFGTAPFNTLTSKRLAETDVKMTSIRQKWCQNIKIVILTSWSRVILHSSCKTTFPSPGRVHGNPGRVCKKRFVSTGENCGNPSLVCKKNVLNYVR